MGNVWAIRAQAFGFALGSILFAAGALTAQLRPSYVTAANVEYVIGAVFFTLAAAVQAGISVRAQIVDSSGIWATYRAWRNPDLVASVVQLVGTLYFNVMTINALSLGAVTASQANAAVWRPDLIGSAMFLISSLIAFTPVARRRRHEHVKRRSVWICNLNLLGSVAFGVSVIGARYLPDGALRNETLANAGTFIGALCFYAAAVLLLPRWDRLSKPSS